MNTQDPSKMASSGILRAMLTLSLLGAVVIVAGGAVGHNPAMTVHEPVPFDEGLLVAGGEGTVAFLGVEGQAAWQQNTTWLAPQAPVVAGDTAALPARSADGSQAALLGFDEQGPAWEVPLQGEGIPWVAASQDTFMVVTTQGNVTIVSEGGEIRGEEALGFGARVAPVSIPGSGFVVAGPDGIALVDDAGQIVEEGSLEGRPTSITASEEHVIVSTFVPGEDARVTVFDVGLEEAWSVAVDALRVGGRAAITEEGGIVLGTFDPDGARILRFTEDGEEAWSVVLEDQTAAAVSLRDGVVYASANDAVLALDAASGDALWETDAAPRVVSPSVAGDLVLPAGAANEALALDAGSGEVMWSWSDGVEEVAWYGHGGGLDRSGEEGERDVGAPVGAVLAAVVVAGWLGRRVRGA